MRRALTLAVAFSLAAQDEKKISLDLSRAYFGKVLVELAAQACPGKAIQISAGGLQEHFEPKTFTIRFSGKSLIEALDLVADTLSREGGREVRFRLDPPDVILLTSASTHTSANLPFRQIPKAYAGPYSVALTGVRRLTGGVQIDALLRREFETGTCVAAVSNVTLKAGRTSVRGFDKTWERLAALNPNTRELSGRVKIDTDQPPGDAVESVELDLLVCALGPGKDEQLSIQNARHVPGEYARSWSLAGLTIRLEGRLTADGRVSGLKLRTVTAEGFELPEATESLRLLDKSGAVLTGTTFAPEDLETVSLKRFEVQTRRVRVKLAPTVRFPIDPD